MKREELSQLLCDMVLASANGGHLGSNGVHVLTQGNTVLLRLILICVKPCGERMNLVCQGLSQTGGDLRVSVHGVACNRCGCWGIIVSLLIRIARALELRLGQWYGKALLHLLLGVQHRDLSQATQLSNE